MLRKLGISNVKIIAFTDTYTETMESLPENIIVIWALAKNLKRIFDDKLPGVKVDVVYSYGGLHFLLDKQQGQEFLGHVSLLWELLGEEGIIVSDILTRARLEAFEKISPELGIRLGCKPVLKQDKETSTASWVLLEKKSAGSSAAEAPGQAEALHSADVAAGLVKLIELIAGNIARLNTPAFDALVRNVLPGLDEQNLGQQLQEARQKAAAISDEDFGRLKSALQEAIRDTAASAAKAPAAPEGATTTPPAGAGADGKGGIDGSPRASSSTAQGGLTVDPSQKPLGINSPAGEVGGIDFRALPAVTQPMGQSEAPRPIGRPGVPLSAGTGPVGTGPLGRQDIAMSGSVPVDLAELDKDWRQIENMVKAGIIPSCQRLKEYLQASCTGPGCQERIDKVLSCIADIFRLEEERVSSTDQALREVLVALESGRPANELQLALSGIEVGPK
jgi:hypothetical protein